MERRYRGLSLLSDMKYRPSVKLVLFSVVLGLLVTLATSYSFAISAERYEYRFFTHNGDTDPIEFVMVGLPLYWLETPTQSDFPSEEWWSRHEYRVSGEVEDLRDKFKVIPFLLDAVFWSLVILIVPALIGYARAARSRNSAPPTT